MGDRTGGPDDALAERGRVLAAVLPGALASWTSQRLAALRAGRPDDEALDRELALSVTDAADDLAASLTELAAADVDAQRATPLQLVRAALAGVTAVLESAGVTAPARDRFLAERHPADRYDLAPPSLAALGAEAAEAGIGWGAAKAVAHRARHGS